MREIEQLVEISRYYGSDSRYVVAGGGNTSYKDGKRLWVKASGHSLATITEEGFAVMDRAKLDLISTRRYSDDVPEREEEVKRDLADACITKDRRPSVETSLHNIIKTPFVVHLHPAVVNALMCSRRAEQVTAELFDNSALYVPYADPGYTLFKAVERGMEEHRSLHGADPEVIFLQNHGIFVGGESVAEIKERYRQVLDTLESRLTEPLPGEGRGVCECAKDIIPALRMVLSSDGKLKSLKVENSGLIEKFSGSEDDFLAVVRPFTPDHIVYCKSDYLYLGSADPEDAKMAVERFALEHGYLPKVIMIKGLGLVSVGDNTAASDIVSEVFGDMLKIAWMAGAFGGANPMTREQVDFIDNWEVENYRRKVGAPSSAGRMENKTVVITGAAQGFGAGIASCLMGHGANIVVADLNEALGSETAASLNVPAKCNKAIFVKTDVSDTSSLANLVHMAVCAFGGIDVFVSNAGILRAGNIGDMSPEVFDLVTRVNYSAYFYCVKAVTPVMKLQNRYSAENYCDIIQVNSKSGLRGSKANFAYAGSKFGGVGLTQSFALELAPFRIKVNSICPGNYYEGPLWSDPENGLFVQYLRAGKVPGAETVEDVREYYMSQVPMGRGTNPEDVTRAILYAVEQTCETGQAIPVTGGQVMMG